MTRRKLEKPQGTLFNLARCVTPLARSTPSGLLRRLAQQQLRLLLLVTAFAAATFKTLAQEDQRETRHRGLRI